MKIRLHPPAVEILETRIAPSTVNVVGGVLIFTAGAGETNLIDFRIQSGSYRISDGADPTITIEAQAAGFVSGGAGTGVVTGPTTVTGIVFNLGDGNDVLNVQGLADPLTVNGGAGSDFFTTNNFSDAVTLDAGGGAISIDAESVSLSASSGTPFANASTVTIKTDDFQIGANGGITASQSITIMPSTASRGISLGFETPVALSLAQSEIALLNAPLEIFGSKTMTNNIVFQGATDFGTATVSLRTGLGVVTNAASTMAAGALAVDSNANAKIVVSSGVSTVAAVVQNSAANFTITDPDGFQIGSLDGITGITTTGASSYVSITAGSAGASSVTQAAGANISTDGLVLSGADTNTFTLTNAGNHVNTIAGTGAVAYTDADALTIGMFFTSVGLTANGGDISVTTLAGDLSVTSPNGPGTYVNAIGGKVSLTAGAAGSDFAVNIAGGAGVQAGGDISLIADHLSIGAPVASAAGTVTLAPFESATTIDLGGADAAATLGVDLTELSFIVVGALQIGAIGATGAVNVSAAIAPANVSSLVLGGGSVTGAGTITAQKLAVISTGNLTLTGANDVDFLSFVSTGGAGTNAFNDADGFSLGDASGFNNFDQTGINITTLDVGTATVTFPDNTGVVFGINGITAGTGYDQIAVNGTVNLGGASLTVNAGGAVPTGTEFVIIANDGADAVTGTFDGLDEGDAIPGFSPAATITYMGGDGNDVAIITVDPLGSTPSANGKSITLTDVDGDLVTITASKGTFNGSEVSGVTTGPNNAGRFEKLTLGAGFAGANITITAKPGANGGNGFVNLGFLDATGVDLGNVSIAGDLARLSAGTVGGDVKVPALKSLTVQSLGLFGDSTLSAADATFLGLQLQGALPKLTIKDDLRASIEIVGATDGKLGTATIGGSFTGFQDISAEAGIGLLKIVGDVRAVGGALLITTTGAIGAVTVDGSIVGESATNNVLIAAFGQLTAPTKGTDIALKNLTVKGSVENASIVVGTGFLPNADASIGSISVGGDWIASLAVAGTDFGADLQPGTADDAKVAGGARDNADIMSSIGSFTVKGQALGTAATTDMFGVVAEQIGKAKVGGRTFAFTKTGSEAFFAAPTLLGAGTGNPAFDFTIRELGAATPTGMVTGGVDLKISADGKTATFNDVDGDLVTVKRTAGAFIAGDFIITPTASGGGQLTKLNLTAAPNNAPVSVTFTAKPGADGGNGFVNVGEIAATSVVVGTLNIAGDLGEYNGGLGVNGKPGTAAIAVHSYGQLGTSTGASNVKSTFSDSLGKLAVAADVRGVNLLTFGTATIGDVTIGGAFIAVGSTGIIGGAQGLGTVKIGGSVLGARLQADSGEIGAITIGGDLVGSGTPAISAFGQVTALTKGADLAVKSLTIKGSIENVFIDLGEGDNADASIGAVSVGQAWIASSLAAGVRAGTDGFFGTTDDETVGPVRNASGSFSTIASITIKGQALGTPAGGDSFGIVAEQIGGAKIGTVKLKFDQGERDAADAFAIAPTLPGVGVLPFDFYVREITV